jgi:phosphate starvation-inducible membrane PsiE
MVHVLNQIMIHVLMYLRRTKKFEFDMLCTHLKGFENHHHKQVRFVINIKILAITRNDCIRAFHLNIPVTELCTPSHIPIPHPSLM